MSEKEFFEKIGEKFLWKKILSKKKDGQNFFDLTISYDSKKGFPDDHMTGDFIGELPGVMLCLLCYMTK